MDGQYIDRSYGGVVGLFSFVSFSIHVRLCFLFIAKRTGYEDGSTTFVSFLSLSFVSIMHAD